MNGTSQGFTRGLEQHRGVPSPPRAGWRSCSHPSALGLARTPRGQQGHPNPVGQEEQRGQDPAWVTLPPQHWGVMASPPAQSQGCPGGCRGSGRAAAAFSTRDSSGTARRGAGGREQPWLCPPRKLPTTIPPHPGKTAPSPAKPTPFPAQGRLSPALPRQIAPGPPSLPRPLSFLFPPRANCRLSRARRCLLPSLAKLAPCPPPRASRPPRHRASGKLSARASGPPLAPSKLAVRSCGGGR